MQAHTDEALAAAEEGVALARPALSLHDHALAVGPESGAARGLTFSGPAGSYRWRPSSDESRIVAPEPSREPPHP